MDTRKILLIEDDHALQENLAEILKMANYEVFKASNGKEGVDMAGKTKPDLIICDVAMPELDGFGVLHLLKKKIETCSIPFVFLTANTQLRKGMNLGADDYINKPFDNEELLNIVQTRLKKDKEHKESYVHIEHQKKETLEDLKKWTLKILEGKKVHFYKRKETIFSEGDSPIGLFFLKAGKVKTSKCNEDAKEYITALYKEGDFIGSFSLLSETNCKESATALEDCEIYFIPEAEFNEILQTNGKITNEMLRLLAHNICEREERLLSLAYSSVRRRVADSLLMVKKKYETSEPNKDFIINFSREDLANIAGVAKETLIRTISSFKDDSLIDTLKGKIVIVNTDGLRRLKN